MSVLSHDLRLKGGGQKHYIQTRPDTRLPQSRAGGQGLYLKSLNYLGRRSEAKDCKNPKKVKCDGPTDGPTDKADCRVA